MIAIGLTGGFHSGKTTVSQMLKELGAEVIDADKVGHEAYRPGTPIWNEVVAAFGKEILQENGEVDRKKLGAIVFNDPQALRKLNLIMHPRMFQMLKDMVEERRRNGTKVVVVEAAVLLEAHWEGMADQIWVTIVSEETALRRLRPGITPEDARARIRSQLSTEQRMKYADVVIDTDRPMEEVRARVKELWRELDPDHPGTPKASSIPEPPSERLW